MLSVRADDGDPQQNNVYGVTGQTTWDYQWSTQLNQTTNTRALHGLSDDTDVAVDGEPNWQGQP